MNRRTVFGLIGAASAALAIAACSPTAMTKRPDIASVLATNDQFSTLVAAATAAGLVPTLQGPGPYTVFAPSDYAFSQLPAGTVDNLLKPENKAKLAQILTYHVVPGAVTSSQLIGQRVDVATVEGQTVHIDGRNGVKVNGVTVSQADIMASNGVIHRIDRVLLPK